MGLFRSTAEAAGLCDCTKITKLVKFHESNTQLLVRSFL
jgi:hypothetical protein